MDVSRTFRIVSLSLLLAMPSSVSFAQGSRSSYDPADPRNEKGSQQSKPKQGLLDFTLGRMNLSDKNYGACIDESRKLMIEETIEDGRFWSNVVALGLLGGLFIVIVYQHQLQTRRGWSAAEMLSQYEHALTRANAQASDVTSKNHGLMEALTALRESALRSHSTSVGPLESTAVPPAVSLAPRRATGVPAVPLVTAKDGPAKSVVDHSADIATATEHPVQIALFRPEVDLITKVNSLEQQLNRSEEREKHLRRQLNESARKLQAEQDKNHSLKGE